MRGCIHIYCGDGKGKTTAAMGLALRAVGAGLKVLICQFLKSGVSSELNLLRSIRGIYILDGAETNKFIFQMVDEEKQEYSYKCEQLLNNAFNLVKTEKYDMLILDELCAAITMNMLNSDAVLTQLKNKPDILEVVITGRDPLPQLVEMADYVSEIKKIKHPFDQGIPARKGIEE